MQENVSNSHNNGFTLIEMLVSVGIISIMTVVISQAFFTSTRSSVKVEITKDAKQNGSFALNVMERMIRGASRVTSTCSRSGTTSTSLTIENPDGQTTTFGCSLDNGTTRISSSSALMSQYLTSSNLTLGGLNCGDSGMTLSFTCTSFADLAPRVSVEFTLTQGNNSPNVVDQARSEFQTTVNVRNVP